MSRFHPRICRTIALALVAWPGLQLSAAEAYASAGEPAARELAVSEGNRGAVLHGGVPGAAKAPVDTVYLYGGPGSLAGKFQTPSLAPDWQGWVGVDLTAPADVSQHWRISAFNASILGLPPPYWSGPYTEPDENHALWEGVPTGTSGYATSPGYGNDWSDTLERRFAVTNPANPTALTWDFVFHQDTEPNHDFLRVQWNSAGTWLDLAVFSGTNRDPGGDFIVPRTFHAALSVLPGMYTGATSDSVHLRLRFESDQGGSDEDGLWDTDGAIQVDNIQVVGDNGIGVSQATFEDGALGGWATPPPPFAGDFSKVFRGVACQVDPCIHNVTPQVTFIDDGTPPNNDPLRSTGGSTWPAGNPSPDCWVVNYTGGLSNGVLDLDNEVWSPPFDWDLPGGDDDAAEGGAFLRFSVYAHIPQTYGLYYVWHLRSWPDPNTGGWTDWRDRGFVYYSARTEFRFAQVDVRDLVVAQPQLVQIALGVKDLSQSFPSTGDGATVAPCFDNVAFARYDAAGPILTTQTTSIFQDGFAESGAAGCAAPAGDYAVRVDMARNIRPSIVTIPVAGDSMVVDIVAREPGSVVDEASIRMGFVLQTQLPDQFAAARSAALTALGAIQIAPDKWRGQVPGRRSTNSIGVVVANRWYFDLPDGATTTAAYQTPELPLCFAGDQIRYFVQAAAVPPTAISLLPADTTGFASGAGYNRTYTIHALPTLRFTGPTTCVQPPVLVWNELEHRGGEAQLLQSFLQNGLREGREFDVYTPKGPTSLVSNGLGGVHGANAAQLAGYSCLFFESGDLSTGLISDGSGAGNNDRGNDVAVLTAWMGQAADRYAAYWGDNIGVGLTGGGATYLSTVMNVMRVGNNVFSFIGNQTAPAVEATAAGVALGFGTGYIAYGGCLGLNLFDNLNPRPGAVKAHEFLTYSGTGGVYTPSASVYYARTDTIAGQPYDRVNVTFPYGLCYVQDSSNATNQGGGRSARANLVRELLTAFGHASLLDAFPTAADVAGARLLRVSSGWPNPFNPATQILVTAPARGRLTARVFNVRGERVAILTDADVDAGEHRLEWRGVDARGRAVASGLYLLEVSGFGQREVRKLALIR